MAEGWPFFEGELVVAAAAAAVSFLIAGSSPSRTMRSPISETVIGSDSFNRANGALGAGWTDDSDAGLVDCLGPGVRGTGTRGISGPGRVTLDQFSS